MGKYRNMLFVAFLAVILCGCGREQVQEQQQKEQQQEEQQQKKQQQQMEPQQAQSQQTQQKKAVYLGVENYGAEETNKDNKDHFTYRFEIDGQEEVMHIDNGTKDEDGDYGYPLQNALKEGYSYEITVTDGVVTKAEEIAASDQASFEPVVGGIPGEKTLKNFLSTALMPVGTALFVYGGGWDWQDKGSAVQARTIGISPDWVRFFEGQDGNYTYRDKDGDEANRDPAASYYPYGGYNEYYYAGLDCSGYLGWVLYNTFETESGNEGYVVGAADAAKSLSDAGYGQWMQDVKVPDGSAETAMKPGDIMSIDGHVWISLGTCGDGSVVIVHSTPTNSRSGQPGGGVQIGAVGTDEVCEAYCLADYYMSEFYPAWYSRYDTALKDPEGYFAFGGDTAGRFSWEVTGANGGLTDPDGMREMFPQEVLAELFGTAP